MRRTEVVRLFGRPYVGPEGPTPLTKAVGAGGEEFEEAEVSEDLELLADFVGDVTVLLVREVEPG